MRAYHIEGTDLYFEDRLDACKTVSTSYSKIGKVTIWPEGEGADLRLVAETVDKTDTIYIREIYILDRPTHL